MNANTIIQVSSFMKTWLEETLGFGHPFNMEAATGLFKNKFKGLNYSQNNSAAVASVGVMSLAEWNVTHSNELGTVFHGISGQVMARVRQHIDKSLNESGFAVDEFANDTKSMVMMGKIIDTIDSIEECYRQAVTNDVKVRHTLTVRKHGNEYNLVMRVLFESEVEQIYVVVSSANVVSTVKLNIEMKQIERVNRLGRVSLECFNNHNGLFRKLGPVDIVPRLTAIAFMAARSRVQNEQFKMGSLLSETYLKFREEALANKELFVSTGENYSVFDTEQLAYLDELDDPTADPVCLSVLGFVTNMMVEQISEILAHNHNAKM